MLRVARLEPVVLYHARGAVGQHQRMRLRSKCVARNIDDTRHLALRREDGRRRAMQEAVLRQVVLTAAHLHGAALGRRSANGIGATHVLVPGHAALQGHALRLVQKSVVAQGVHQRAVGIGQHQHAVPVFELAVKKVHHRLRKRDQLRIALQQACERVACDRVVFDGACIWRNAGAEAARPRTRQALVQAVGQGQPLVFQMLSGLLQAAVSMHAVS